MQQDIAGGCRGFACFMRSINVTSVGWKRLQREKRAIRAEAPHRFYFSVSFRAIMSIG
ncbi:hypothetical protein J5226_16175 [Lysobacter sp. K5869]|uniref:hypothetical protein n=1 Tax=Lysobacter sp. K5869 TaxID=2820808 RepID=UPI001C06225B|nr:hypothetical protein [Lysobacter sp. K5869]QWP75157.1 hypothetical protein J5226_16175 [Lysobacter sp. K5869]